MNLTKRNLAKGFALTTGVLWLFCSVIVALLPEFTRTVTQWWMHGMRIEAYNITFESVMLGGITLVASAWLTGYILGWSLELNSSKRKK